MIDLHGQHAAEGVAVLRRELARLREALGGGAAKRSVYICVGTGSHTKVCCVLWFCMCPVSNCV